MWDLLNLTFKVIGIKLDSAKAINHVFLEPFKQSVYMLYAVTKNLLPKISIWLIAHLILSCYYKNISIWYLIYQWNINSGGYLVLNKWWKAFLLGNFKSIVFGFILFISLYVTYFSMGPKQITILTVRGNITENFLTSSRHGKGFLLANLSTHPIHYI